MTQDEQQGVVFPAGPDGRRSTAALGRAVTADALRPVDAAGALAAERETNWRGGYLTHFRRLVEAGLPAAPAARTIAEAGLTSLHERMRVAGPDGETDLDGLVAAPAGRALHTVEVRGTAEPERELSLPFHGGRLRGDALLRQLDAWVAAGVVEPTCAEAVRTVAAHPEWLALPDSTVVVLGAGAEMGPLTALLRWGARVAGVDLPRAPLWERVLDTARGSAGTLLVPVDGPAADVDPSRAGADLIT